MKYYLIILTAIFSSCVIFGTSNPTRNELLQLEKEDQAIRTEMASKGMGTLDSALFNKMRRFDSLSTTRLKVLLGNSPWFVKDSVGSSGLEAAFILLQHSLDYDFQKRSLPFIEKQAKAGDISVQDYALLLDRTLIHDNKPQVYGTQIQELNGEMVPYPIEDSLNVDNRRAEIGLFPMNQYMSIIREFYKANSGKK